jgi:hypothetical protein
VGRFKRFLTASVVSLSAAVALSGCASTQLNHNTLELASTVGDIQTQQVLYNLGLMYDNPAAIPTHVDLSGGSAATTNAVNPTIGAPFNAATSTVDTVARAATTTTTTQGTVSNAASTVSLQMQDQWTQNWSYDPVTGGEELRRLRALYLFALGFMNQADLIREYPLVEKGQQVNYGSGQGGAEISNDPIYCPDIGLVTNGGTTEDIGRTQKPGGKTAAQCSGVSTNIQIPDEHFLHEPGCILCIGKRELYTRRSRLWVNPRLAPLNGGWLLINSTAEDAKALGVFAGQQISVRRRDLFKLAEFTLFILSATEQSSTGAASGGGGGGSKKGTKGGASLLVLQPNSSNTIQRLPVAPAPRQ